LVKCFYISTQVCVSQCKDPVCKEVLENAVSGITHDGLPICGDDPAFAAAKGVAELGRRALVGQDGIPVTGSIDL
jgi:hypothetical protein